MKNEKSKFKFRAWPHGIFIFFFVLAIINTTVVITAMNSASQIMGQDPYSEGMNFDKTKQEINAFHTSGYTINSNTDSSNNENYILLKNNTPWSGQLKIESLPVDANIKPEITTIEVLNGKIKKSSALKRRLIISENNQTFRSVWF